MDPTQNTFGLKTADGHTISAVNGGGMGGPNDASCPVHTDAPGAGPWEKLTLEPQSDGSIAIRTSSGNYVSAVNKGGFGGPNNVPIHTDAT